MRRTDTGALPIERPSKILEQAKKTLALGLGAAALFGAAHSAKSETVTTTAEPMPYFGYDTNKIWVEDKSAAIAEAQDVHEAGGTVIRILTPYTVGGHEINNDKNRYCNSLEATSEFGQRLEIGLDGHFRDGRFGYFPTQLNEMKKLRTGLYNMMAILASGECDGVKATELNIGFNEPNYKLRYEQPDMPKNLARLLVYLAPLMRQDAKSLNVDLQITAADITLSDANDPIDFIKEFSSQLTAQLKPGQPLPFDRFGLNYYAFGQFTAENIQTTGQATSLAKAVDLLREQFGQDLPIGISELGAFSSTPVGKEQLYSQPVPSTVRVLSGNKQGQFYQNIINVAACLGLDGVRIFHKSDDGDDVLRTGDHYPDGTPKPSAEIVQQSVTQNNLAQIACPK